MSGARFVSPKVARELLDIHRNTLLRWEQAGRLPNVRRLPGGHRRYLLADLRACLKVAA